MTADITSQTGSTNAGHTLGHSMPLSPATCNFVLDLETIGIRPPCPVLQIGVTCIETKETLGIQLGLPQYPRYMRCGVDYERTLVWWNSQDAAVRYAVFANGLLAREAPRVLQKWLEAQAKRTGVPLADAIVWANDPEFDCVILRSFLEEEGAVWPFNFRNHRSFRTLHAQMQETVGYSVWSHNASARFKEAITADGNWTPVEHTGHGDSALEAMAIVAMQNIVYKRGCQMNTLRSSYAGWNLTLVG